MPRVHKRFMVSDEITKILGIVGGVTGPLGLVVSYLTYHRDRAKVRVKLTRGYQITQGPQDDETVRRMLAMCRQHEEQPPMALYVRDPDKTWASLDVVNVGRRKIIIEKIGWLPKKGTFRIPAGFFSEPGWLPAELDEGVSKSFPIEEGNLSEGVLAAWACDSMGRLHYGTFERSLLGMLLRLKILLRLRPYSRS